MKKTSLAAAAALLLTTAGASAQMLEITEVYGAGGNTGATYSSDFVELYNPSTLAVSLSGYSLQYAAATRTGAFAGTSTTLAALSGTVQPQSYFLIQLAGGSNGSAIPTPNFTYTGIDLGSTAGKVALANSTTAVTGSTGTNVVDFVGYGTTANDYKGSGPAPAPSATNSISRSTLIGPSTNNASDFTAGTPSPTASVPEPSTYAAIASGLATLGLLRFRRRHA